MKTVVFPADGLKKCEALTIVDTFYNVIRGRP